VHLEPVYLSHSIQPPALELNHLGNQSLPNHHCLLLGVGVYVPFCIGKHFSDSHFSKSILGQFPPWLALMLLFALSTIFINVLAGLTVTSLLLRSHSSGLRLNGVHRVLSDDR